MVTRTYKCENCGEFDLEQSIKDDPIKFCPNCEGTVKQKYYSEPLDGAIMFNNPHCGAISHRFLPKGGTKNGWNLRTK